VSASDNLSQQLFHGTGAVIPTGGLVKTPDDVTYATTSYGYAKAHAEDKLHRPAVPTPNWQMPMFNPIYEVTPVSKAETRKTTKAEQKHAPEHMFSNDVAISEKGFKVKRVAGWAAIK